MSLSKTIYPLLSTGTSRKTCPNIPEKLLTGTQKNQIKQICLLGDFCMRLSYLLGFFHNKLFQKILSGIHTIKVSNSLDPDHAGHFVGPDLDLNWVQTKGSQQSTL